ncbi:integrase arm-type DNA-binding domain-containing protein [Nisaea acidiphila]|uniref:Integrase arm-type DNA-binding domain-containing protein n=1 Tax=Nisaea acidiphila TaxID=1862145 RepID=A0A9J7ANY4_9PROT|nr:site-specific integrase [Nisaea acidiphila]UUX48919.1 integrase arm-type DNA-binding domain-containing protein [Nisaea acidiphila]
MNRLTAKTVKSLKDPGLYGDGNALYLRIGPKGGKSWILRTVVHGRRRDIGLGSAGLVSLAEARELAIDYRRIARNGGDPIAEKRRKTIRFSDAIKTVHENNRGAWSSEKHADKWLASLQRYAEPTLGDMPIEKIGISEVLEVLTPIWTEKSDTAKRVKQRLSTIFDWARGAGYYHSENPTNGIERALPTVKRSVEHMRALPWRELPSFMKQLSEREGLSARTLEFLILTATRSGEARGARWSEIQNGLWVLPKERMKADKPHRVPLTGKALEVLEAVRGLDTELVFPSDRRGKGGHARPQSDQVFARLLERMKRTDFTVHGLRSTFRDWCSEYDHAEREVAEAALAHALGDKVERAYARSDMFDRRKELMERWERFCLGK